MQVTDLPVGEVDIGDVGHPDLDGGSGYQPRYQILPFTVTMVGICRVPFLTRWQHQPVATQKPVEAVAALHRIGTEKGTKHDPQFVAPDTGIFRADLTHVLHYEAFTLHFFFKIGFQLVESLAAMAKQTAGDRDFQATIPDQFLDYLAPDFFRMGMLKHSSARVISRSRASVSKREKDKAFSNSLMRFFNCAFSSR